MRKLHSILLALCASVCALQASAAITEQAGWFETAYAKWEPVAGADDYDVYVKPEGGQYTQLDAELVRQYPTYFRADAVGLAAGTYRLKVVPKAKGAELGSALETGALVVKPHDRSGFAHYKNTPNAIGAYNDDGTLKANAKVIYITAAGAKTVTTKVLTGKAATDCTGWQAIVAAYQKGLDHTPIAFRIVGTVKAADLDYMGSSSEGLQVKGKTSYSDMPLTFEGIGDDAAVHGFGFLIKNTKNVEFRNFAIMCNIDDGLSFDTDNCND